MSNGVIGYRDQVGATPDRSGKRLRDIRRFIAASQLPQMDPNNFDKPDYKRYPLMPVDKNNQPFKDSVGRCIVLHDAADEEAFHADYPDIEPHRDPEDTRNEMARLREENLRLKKQAEGVSSHEDDDPLPDKDAASPEKPTVAGLVHTRSVKKKTTGPAPGSKLD